MHVGTDFVFAYFKICDGSFNCDFTITALADATVHLTVPAVDLDRTDHIAQGTYQLCSLECDFIEVSGAVEEKSIIVRFNADVQVEAMAQFAHGDMSLALDPYYTLSIYRVCSSNILLSLIKN